MTTMKKNVFLTVTLVLLVAGCASTEKPRADGDQATPAAEAPAEGLVVKPITAPPTPAEIKDFGDRMRAIPEAMYSVARNAYSIYLGGQYTATYYAGDGSLGLVADGENKTCTYTAQAELKEKSEEGFCRQWLNQLNDALLHYGK